MNFTLCLAALSSLLFVPFSSKAEDTFDLPGSLKSFSSNSAAELRLPPGRYRLPKEGLLLEKFENKTILAQGVTLVATDWTPALQLRHCKNLTIVGLTIDYDPLPFTQGTITAVNPEQRTLDLQIHTGYPELSEAYLEEKQAHLFQKDSARWKAGAPDYYPKKIERLTPTTARLFFSPHAAGFDLIEVGDRLALCVRKKSGININAGCAGLRFQGVTLHTAPGIGFLVRFAEDAGQYEDVRVLPGPRPPGATEDRLLSTSADAFNAAYTRKGPELTRCEFAFMGDDSVNLHGVMLPVLRWDDERTFLSMRPNRGEPFEQIMRSGDEIRFLREPDYAITASPALESIERVQEESATWAKAAQKIWPTFKESTSASFYRIRLRTPLPETAKADFIEVPALNAPHFVIRESYFHDHRARGLRLMSSDGLVQNNRFERLKGSAITLGGEFAFWREAGWCRNIQVTGNQITDVGQSSQMSQRDCYTPGAISIFSRVLPQGEKTLYFPGNKNIKIAGNIIDGCFVNGIHVAAASDVMIQDNTLRRVNQRTSPLASSDYGLSGQKPIVIIQAEATLENNRVE